MVRAQLRLCWEESGTITVESLDEIFGYCGDYFAYL